MSYETATLDWTAEDGVIGSAHDMESPSRQSCPEMVLWLETIRMAQRDAENPQYASSSIERNRERQKARDWLLRNEGDYLFVCHMAGIDPEALRRHAQRELR